MLQDVKIIRGIAVAFAYVLFFAVFASGRPQSAIGNGPEPLLEFYYTFSQGDIYHTKVSVYADGRYFRDEDFPQKAPSGHYRRIHATEEKYLEPSEISDLLIFAETNEFQTADTEYLLAKVVDNGSSVVITYHGKLGVKSVKLINFDENDIGQRVKIPASVLKLVSWGSNGRFDH